FARTASLNQEQALSFIISRPYAWGSKSARQRLGFQRRVAACTRRKEDSRSKVFLLPAPFAAVPIHLGFRPWACAWGMVIRRQRPRLARGREAGPHHGLWQ